MLANQEQSGLSHPVVIQHMVCPASPGMKQRVPDRRGMQQIAVATTKRAETSVKLWLDNRDMSDRYPLGQMGVHAPYPGGFRALGIGIKVNYLPQRVNASVGSPRAYRGDAVACDHSKRLLEMILNGAA